MRFLFTVLLLAAFCRPAWSQSIVMSGGRGSIVTSGNVHAVAAVAAVAVKSARVNSGPSYAELDELRMEIELLKSSLAAAATPVPAPVSVSSPVKPAIKHVTSKVTVPMTHSEMVALHNRLHGGGSGDWTWPGDLATHLRTTHNSEPSKTVTRTEIVKVSAFKALAASAESLYDGRPGSSHENRHSLIDHLMKSSAHIGKHSLSDLMAMTDQQLSETHTEDHYELGQIKVSQPAVRIQSSSASNCPGGVCPIQPARYFSGRSRRSRR